jgi:hypothetical protein
MGALSRTQNSLLPHKAVLAVINQATMGGLE